MAIQAQPQAAKATPKPALGSAPVNLLQRQCACGGNPGPSGECVECRKKRMAGRKDRLQAKLAVNQPGDRWEQEAERMAESVMAAGGSRPGVPIKPAHPALMRQPAAVPTSREAPASVESVLGSSSGRPLERGTRNFMEDRFGCDFSRVRIHHDQRAAESARDVNALAYTVGQNVVFAAGQYAPGSHAGQKLLAHELAHTLQQEGGMPLVRRKTGPFTVDGLYEKRAAETDFVFFDREQPAPSDTPPESVLDSAEEGKIKTKAKAALDKSLKEITLYGFASEEGDSKENSALIQRRMTAVQNVLEREGFKAPNVVHQTEKLACSNDKYDYRLWRAVEMREGTEVSSRVCKKKEGARPACDKDHMDLVDAARNKAKGLIDGTTGALMRLDAFLAKPADEPDVATALDKYFGKSHTPATAKAVRERVQAIWDFLDKMGKAGGATVLCGSDDEPTCHTGSPASASHDSQEVIVCDTFFNDSVQKAKQDEILIHESSHGSSFATDDRAYQKERVILILSTAQALQNAQSLTQFIMAMNGKARPLGPDNPDKVTGCDPDGGDKQETLVREALAWAQRWNTYAMYGTAQTYANPSNTSAMTPYITAHFGRADRAAIAGIYDRYHAMDGWFDLFFNVRCAAANDTACTGTHPVTWNLTGAVSPAGGGPVKKPESTSMPASSTSSSAPASDEGKKDSTAPALNTTTAPASSSTSTTTPAPTSSSTAAPATPAGDITVCPSFFKLGTLYDRTVEMYAGLAAKMPGVSDGLSRSYPRLAYNYKTQYWKVL